MSTLRKKIEKNFIEEREFENWFDLQLLLSNLVIANRFHLNKFIVKALGETPHFINLTTNNNKVQEMAKVSLNSDQVTEYFQNPLPKDLLYELVKKHNKDTFSCGRRKKI